ncbi:hypothetical protein CYY_002037 [Polysphondylium violaceum]|uniref:Thioredoxin domain-containing protein n=1 Tax=Polysphondylium violaceum TaxID=133409 RepID=A0A8J4V7B0_9MYCE|nr:hypothetical protein CYY_002037 [Polysphondylium violaceum]
MKFLFTVSLVLTICILLSCSVDAARPPQLPEGVVELTTENFNQIVNNPSKHVFVHVYAPWSAHCKRLFPLFGGLGRSFKNNDQVVIARFNCVDNLEFCEAQFPEVQSQYPSVYFIDKSNAKHMYNGPREVANMENFILNKINEVSRKRSNDEL